MSAVLLRCNTCGLVRIADDYTAAHQRGEEHKKLSGHQALTYSVVEAPERLKYEDGPERKRSRKGNQ